MNGKGKNRWWRKTLMFFTLIFVMLWPGVIGKAAGFYENSFLSFSPDRKAWTVRDALPKESDAGNRVDPSCWYPLGETVETGIKSSLTEPGKGEHYYKYDRHGLVPVQKWVVVQRTGRCIHNSAAPFHGVELIASHCESSYYSGWHCYCADCGEKLMDFHVYLSRERVRELTAVDTDLGYYYLCPTCGHIEQGTEVRHQCKAVSANRYRVKYLQNGGNVSGFMQSSFHMYGNAEEFEGEPVTPNRTLSLNSYARTGYVFTGWNTMADGSGEAFGDGCEILNLTDENYDEKDGKGTVYLYAQWERVTGTLEIDPAGGTYRGNKKISSVKVGYGELYEINTTEVVPPDGYVVSFEVNGGEQLDGMMDQRFLAGWKLLTPAKGYLEGNAYKFYGRDGEKDRVTAIYQSKGIHLPLPVKKGFSFGGWYYDAALNTQAGNAGDFFVPKEDQVLYACWVDLVLEAKVNLIAQGGKGAVDLSWRQLDGKQKTYLLFQKGEEGEFRKIHEDHVEESGGEVPSFESTAETGDYLVEHTGFYKLTAKGAQGGDYDENKGGLGGSVEGVFYLQAGDRLQFSVGKKQDGTGGTGEKYGDGGGRTSVVSKELGTLLVAGGGGGAMPGTNGGDGGSEDGLRADGLSDGEDGMAGGGAGFVGGRSGIYERHIHTQACIHVHVGDEISGGDCYKEVEEVKLCHVVVSGPNVDWARSDNCDACIRAGRGGYGTMHPRVWRIEHFGCGQPTDNGSAGWWVCSTCGAIGYQWGSGMGRPSVSDHTFTRRKYVLDCDREYDCGNPPGKLVASCGGSNFVDEERAISFQSLRGEWEGDGKVYVEAVNIGFLEKMELNGVYAPDLEAPDEIELETVHLEAVGDRLVCASFQKPADHGSIYYHQVHSYLPGRQECLSDSNVTFSEVITGVAGYYYLLDQLTDTKIERKNGEVNGSFCVKEEIIFSFPEELSYLHLAAVDRAGNLGKTVSVTLAPDQCDLTWKPCTEKITISSEISGMEYGSVVPAEGMEDCYYIRANGRTPFLLRFAGRLLGDARQDYQIDKMTFEYDVLGGVAKGSCMLGIPNGNLSDMECLYDGGQMSRLIIGTDLLQPGMYGRAVRTDKMSHVMISQGFCMDFAYDKKLIRVIPRAAASLEGESIHSDPEEDANNGIWLIGDGEPPSIKGVQESEKALQREQGENATLDLSAVDSGSGVAVFTVCLRNLDNGYEAIYYADEDGCVRICMEENNPLFLGDLQLKMRAADRVGNVTELQCGADDIGLKAEVFRVLSPHEPIFKRGESGLLRIKARGYVERLEVEFPPEFTAGDPTLNCVFSYETPLAIAMEEILFMVPLEGVPDGGYEITVKAYKGGNMLEDKPSLCALVVGDTVLGEIRTRLR